MCTPHAVGAPPTTYPPRALLSPWLRAPCAAQVDTISAEHQGVDLAAHYAASPQHEAAMKRVASALKSGGELTSSTARRHRPGPHTVHLSSHTVHLPLKCTAEPAHLVWHRYRPGPGKQLYTLLRYRTSTHYRSGEFLGPRIGDKVCGGTLLRHTASDTRDRPLLLKLAGALRLAADQMQS